MNLIMLFRINFWIFRIFVMVIELVLLMFVVISRYGFLMSVWFCIWCRIVIIFKIESLFILLKLWRGSSV